MIRRSYTIDDLKMSIKLGWKPVYAAYAKDNKNKPLQVVEINLIVEWKLDDDKVMLISIPYETRQELADIVSILKSSAKSFTEDIMEKFTKLSVAQVG